jgi:hypothetical protein
MLTPKNVYGLMSDAERMAMWTCAICDKVHAVPGLARECEEKHMTSGD